MTPRESRTSKLIDHYLELSTLEAPNATERSEMAGIIGQLKGRELTELARRRATQKGTTGCHTESS